MDHFIAYGGTLVMIDGLAPIPSSAQTAFAFDLPVAYDLAATYDAPTN